MKLHLALAIGTALLGVALTDVAAPARAAGNGTALAALPASQVWLRPNITAEGRDITLGDLFENAGTAAHRTFAAAPAPGEQANFRVVQVLAAAEAANLQWQPDANLRYVSVSRIGKLVPRREILDQLADRIARQSGEPRMPVLLSDRNFSLSVATDEAPTVRVEDLDYDARSQRFTAVLVAPANDKRAPRVRVQGRVHQVAEVPVLKVRYGSGQIIREADLDWIEVGTDRLTADIITDAAALIGQATKRPLAAGTLVRGNDVQRPVLVGKGALVTMSLSTPHMSLTTTGRALDAGGIGEAIQVTNVQSNKTVLATVIGPNQVAVIGNRPLAAAR